MRKQFIAILAVCAACFAWSAQGQNTGGATSSSQSGASSDQTTSQPGYQSGRHFGGAGRMGHSEIRTSQINGAQVKDNQGQDIGTINDLIFNPASGRVDFAVLSVSSTGTGTTSTTGGTSSTSAASSTSALSSAGKMVPVPWMLLRPAAAAGAGSSTSATSTTLGQTSFTFAGDTSKLQSAPSFDTTTDITQPTWRQSVFSHFGMTPGYSTGGATSPGGSESSTGTSSSTTTPPSPGTSPDSSNPSKPPQ